RQDLVYKHEKAKFAAVIEDVAERHKNKQPVLIGTTSVEKSEYVSKLLAKEGIRHEVLNAKNYAREAAIIADAGRPGAVTVATSILRNMKRGGTRSSRKLRRTLNKNVKPLRKVADCTF